MGLTANFNIWAVLIAAILYFILGAIWYSPTLFANQWMEEIGKTKEELQTGNQWIYAVTFLALLLTSFVLVHIIKFVDPNSNIFTGLVTGFFVWLGFSLTTAGVTALYRGNSLKLFMINNGYHLVGFLLMGAFLGLFA